MQKNFINDYDKIKWFATRETFLPEQTISDMAGKLENKKFIQRFPLFRNINFVENWWERTQPASTDNQLGEVDMFRLMQWKIVNNLRIVFALRKLFAVDIEPCLEEINADGVVVPFAVAHFRCRPSPLGRFESVGVDAAVRLLPQEQN